MTPEKLKEIIACKEGTEVEFKKSQDRLARSVYESICAFLNRKGGHVVLYGHINLQTLKPHRKNPVIANVFSQMGIVEELGSGTVKMFKYTPLYSDGKDPVIEEQDVSRIEIPYIATLQAAESGSGLKSGLKETSIKIIEILKMTPDASYEDIAKELGKARSTVADWQSSEGRHNTACRT